MISNDILAASSTDPQIILSYKNNDNSSYENPLNLTFNLTAANLPSSLFSWFTNNFNQNIYITNKNTEQYFVTPIKLAPNTISMHLISIHSKLDEGNTEDITSVVINQLLVPVIILIILISIVSIFVMKKLLNSIDHELY